MRETASRARAVASLPMEPQATATRADSRARSRHSRWRPACILTDARDRRAKARSAVGGIRRHEPDGALGQRLELLDLARRRRPLQQPAQEIGQPARLGGPVGGRDRLPAEGDRTRGVAAVEARLGGCIEQVDPVDRGVPVAIGSPFEEVESPRVELAGLRVCPGGHRRVAGAHRCGERGREVVRLEQVVRDLGGGPGPRGAGEVRTIGQDPGQRGMEADPLTGEEVVGHGLADQGVAEREPAAGRLDRQDRPVDGLPERGVEGGR